MPTVKKRKKLQTEESVGLQPLPPVTRMPIEKILAMPAISSFVDEVQRRRGFQTYMHYVKAWPQTHWWDLQTWINQTQYELEQVFGPIVRLASTQKQVHGGKVHLLAFFEVGPISPMVSPVKVGSAWRQFIETIES